MAITVGFTMQNSDNIQRLQDWARARWEEPEQTMTGAELQTEINRHVKERLFAEVRQYEKNQLTVPVMEEEG